MTELDYRQIILSFTTQTFTSWLENYANIYSSVYDPPVAKYEPSAYSYRPDPEWTSRLSAALDQIRLEFLQVLDKLKQTDRIVYEQVYTAYISPPKAIKTPSGLVVESVQQTQELQQATQLVLLALKRSVRLSSR
jgi:hypothetical protein